MQAQHAKALAEALEKELLQPLVFFLSIQSDEMKTATQRAKELLALAKGKITKADKTKAKYLKVCRDTEALAPSLAAAHKGGNEDSKRKVTVKVVAGKNEIAANEDEYREAVSDLSAFAIEYGAQLVTGMQAITLADIAKLDYARSDRFKTDFGKCLGLEMAKMRRIFSEKERLERPIDIFNPDEEILVFANNTSQAVPMLVSYTYAPYSGEHPMFRVNTLRMVRWGDDWVDVLKEGTEKLNGEVEVLVSKAWHEDILPTADLTSVPITQFQVSLRSPATRRALIYSLNRRRSTKFALPLAAFSNVSQVISMALEVSWEEGDMEVIRDLILTSQTFYLAETSPRAFLAERLRDNELVRKKRFWLGYIDYALGSDLRKGEVIGQEVVSAQLGACLLTMQSFSCDREMIAEVGSEVAERYGIPSHFSNVVLPQSEERPTVAEETAGKDPLGVGL